MGKAQFTAELVQGHKGVKVVMAPFDPEEIFSAKPVKLDSRRHGWLVKGTLNRVAFLGFVGERWGRFFILIEDDVMSAAKVAVGDVVTVAVESTSTAKALEAAREQSKRTTAPSKPRPDAVEPRGSAPRKKATVKAR